MTTSSKPKLAANLRTQLHTAILTVHTQFYQKSCAANCMRLNEYRNHCYKLAKTKNSLGSYVSLAAWVESRGISLSVVAAELANIIKPLPETCYPLASTQLGLIDRKDGKGKPVGQAAAEPPSFPASSEAEALKMHLNALGLVQFKTKRKFESASANYWARSSNAGLTAHVSLDSFNDQ